MAEYGYLIIRNPGPETEIIYGGFTGDKGDFANPAHAIAALKGCREDGDHIHYLTLYSPDESDGMSSQLAADEDETVFSK